MSKVLPLCLICLGFAAVASAGSFTVSLHNGATFESRYQPKAAAWDDNVILVLDELGNWVALERGDVKQVISDVEARGYGRVIDTTTKEFGFAPNDQPVPDEDGGGQPTRESSPLDQILERSYDTPLFSEPSEAGGGFPVFGVGAAGSTTLSSGGGEQ